MQRFKTVMQKIFMSLMFIYWVVYLTVSKKIEHMDVLDQAAWRTWHFVDGLLTRLWICAYKGSQEQVDDALNLEFGGDLNHYDRFQQQLILESGLLSGGVVNG